MVLDDMNSYHCMLLPTGRIIVHLRQAKIVFYVNLTKFIGEPVDKIIYNLPLKILLVEFPFLILEKF